VTDNFLLIVLVICKSSAGDFLTIQIGDESVVVTNSQQQLLRAGDGFRGERVANVGLAMLINHVQVRGIVTIAIAKSGGSTEPHICWIIPGLDPLHGHRGGGIGMPCADGTMRVRVH
jgi:hypothetical protein